MLIAWITDPMDGSALARGRRKDINSVIQSITSAPRGAGCTSGLKKDGLPVGLCMESTQFTALV